MANRAVADNGSAFDDLGDDGDSVVGKQYANAFTDCCGGAADRDKMSIAVHADRNITSETHNAFGT
jgi:hypothetical protein